MAGRDWSEEIFDVLKNSEDVRAIGRAGSLQEQLAIHERMKQRQRANRDALRWA